ncbi:hypothetical protein SO802_019742 [Lithocarpus litseifolius]|uniref:Uncharacterized protein n=1 Tax=Lithocarpus litseifolius TaxID=425828 RepID=A0AAW2CSG4_9ROSI
MAMAVDLSGPGLPSEKVDGSKSLYACVSVCKGYPSYIVYSIKLSQLLPSEYISKSKSEGCGSSSNSDSVTLCSSPTSTLTPISYPTISTSNSSCSFYQLCQKTNSSSGASPSSSSKEQEGCNSYSELKWNRFATLGGNGRPYIMNCCVMGSKIILAGGLLCFPDMSCEYSTWIFTLETNPALDPKPEFQNINKKKKKMKNNNNRKNNFSLKRLSAGKSDPLLVEIEGRLYALAGIPLDPFEELPSPTFEVFDPSTQQWSPLPPPPFFNRNEIFCFAPWHDDARACFDYVVMDSKISVCGPFSVGYTFDIPTKKWFHCLYFAIIGHDQLDNCLRAYFLHFTDGHCQSVPIPVNIPPEFSCCRPNFVHLGDGIICVVMAIVVAEFEELRIFVATFQVSRVNRQRIYLDL